MDVVVTVPRDFTHPAGPGLAGLPAWLAEGDVAGSPWSGTEWAFRVGRGRPRIDPGERVYVVSATRLVGYAPLVRVEPHGAGCGLVRRGGAVACTIEQRVAGFRGYRYRWWPREAERPLRSCRGCGCTDHDCRQCVARTGAPCHWVAPDLCSACQE